MTTPEIRIDIETDGTVRIDAIGFKGQACAKATEALRAALDGDTAKTTLKPEFHEQTIQQQQQVKR